MMKSIKCKICKCYKIHIKALTALVHFMLTVSQVYCIPLQMIAVLHTKRKH